MSEFGKGLVICLVKFAEHFERDGPTGVHRLIQGYWTDFHKKCCNEVYNGDKEKYISHQIELWANGASDHLYEIRVPEGKEWNTIRKKVKKLQQKGLEIGHGFTSKKWTKEDFLELIQLTREIALMIDRKIGLKPDIGKW